MGKELELSHKQLENKVETLTILLNASMELNSELKLKEVLEKVLRLMCRVVQAEAGTLWLLNEEKGIIRAEVANGPKAEEILTITLQPGEGIVGQVIESNQSNLVEDVTKDKNWARRVDRESGYMTRSLMTVPLSVKGVVIGAMQLVNKQGALLFNSEDVKLAEALANQSALAIHNSQMYDELQRFSVSVIRSLTLALDARDPYTAGHSSRVGLYSLWIARKMDLPESKCRELERAALMHDIGKIGVPDQILSKTSRLTDEEFEIMKQHPLHGARILSKMEPKKDMKIAQEVARHHHEKINGLGYPDRLQGKEIPFYARIVAIADAFDAMTTDRPYSKGRTYKEGVEELVRCKNTHFDPIAVDAFEQVMQERNFLINKQERTTINESI
jgi:HD-GYP domain-containing protein (c-di-GMP phosphodiesterase class II)